MAVRSCELKCLLGAILVAAEEPLSMEAVEGATGTSAFGDKDALREYKADPTATDHAIHARPRGDLVGNLGSCYQDSHIQFEWSPRRAIVTAC